MIHPRSTKGSKVVQLFAQDFVLALRGHKLGVGTSKELARLQEVRHTRLGDDLGLSPATLDHGDPTTCAERAETIGGFGSVNSPHEASQHPRLGREHTGTPECLVVEDVADLVDDRQLWVVPETTEPEAQRLAGSVVPLVGAGLGHGARPHDRQ